ncbi:MAG TPA: TIGR03086 family metal-binding protein [Streptosporangiaceae bacterium]|nr:TIGR03086 family metal-binding protein [Streptosporangiaceae bacterium]
MPDIDRRADLARSFAHAATIVAGVSPGQLGDLTTCPDYDVAALIDHLVGAGWRTVALGRGENPTGEEFPHVDLADAPDQLHSAAKQAEAAWSDDARLAATVTMPWGETYTGATLVDMYVAELAAHAWDLAAATGQFDRLDPKLAPGALQAARAMLKPEYRNLMGPGNPFGAEVEAPSDATDWERFAAFMGRQPRR